MRSRLLSLAEEVRSALLAVDPATVTLVERWLRDPIAPDPGRPEEVRATAYLDRVAARDLPLDRRMALLTAAVERLGDGDDVLTRHLEAEIAITDHLSGDAEAAARAAGLARDLESSGALLEASEVWRSLSWFGSEQGSERSIEAARAAANLAGRAHAPLRCALSLVELAMHLGADDPDAATEALAEARVLFGAHPLLASMADDTQARIAVAHGDLDTAAAALTESVSRPGAPVPVQLGHLIDLCGAHLARGDWEALSRTASSALAAAADAGVPTVSDLARGYLGLAQAHGGDVIAGAQTLRRALPPLAAGGSPLAGPVGLTLGDLAAEGLAHAESVTAYLAAATAYERADQIEIATTALLSAADQAALADDPDQARALYGSAAEAAQVTGDLASWIDAERGAAVSAVAPESVDATVAALDAVPERAREVSPRHTEIDWDTVGLQLTCQGAQVLAAFDRVDDAVTRLETAEARAHAEDRATTAWLLRAEHGLVLVDAGRLAEAEPVLRPALAELALLGEQDAAAQSAAILADALDSAHRGDEAATLRARYLAG